MLASIFIAQGYDTLRWPEHVAPRAEKVVGPLKQRVDALPGDTEQLVRINGGVQLVAVPIDYSENTRVLVEELRDRNR